MAVRTMQGGRDRPERLTMEIDIAGKVVVVTGAARGIGRPLALGLAAEGARVRVLARDRAQAQAVVDEIAALADAPPALALQADVGDEAALRAAAQETDAAWGRVDALINNAGWMPGSQRVLDVEVAVLDRVLRSNLIGSFLATKHFEHIERVAASYPGGRIGQPEDIVALTAFVCSDAADHLSGTVITVRPNANR